MKVLTINASPSMEKGNTALILGPFVEGLASTGAEVELFFTKKLNINPCHGEFNCWLKTPGKCYQEDDMQWLHPKLRQADVWVLATPVYGWGVTGPLKNLMDRFLPLLEPFITLSDGHCSHPIRNGAKPKIVLVSNCGFWEMDNFEPLLVHLRSLCRFLGLEFAGALLRPHGPALGAMLEMDMPVSDVLEAAREAGRQLGSTGAMKPETLERISRPLLPLEQYRQFANQNFEQALSALNHTA